MTYLLEDHVLCQLAHRASSTYLREDRSLNFRTAMLKAVRQRSLARNGEVSLQADFTPHLFTDNFFFPKRMARCRSPASGQRLEPHTDAPLEVSVHVLCETS